MSAPVLSVVVRVFDEEAHLDAVIARLFAALLPIAREWIFVDDASATGAPRSSTRSSAGPT
jgi:glycosyltransferase involved in cell wall biosynthesis